MQSIFYCHVTDLFNAENLDSSERVFLDRHCHGLVEWCALHPRRGDHTGLTWLRPRLSRFDHVFVSNDTRSVTQWNKILKFLPPGPKHLYLLKSISQAKEFSDAKGLFDEVDWVAEEHEENPFVGL